VHNIVYTKLVWELRLDVNQTGPPPQEVDESEPLMSMRAQKPSIFFERYEETRHGVSRSYQHIVLAVWESFDPDTRHCWVRFSWLIMDDGELASSPQMLIDDRLGRAKNAMSLAMRISHRVKNVNVSPSELQGILAQMKARKTILKDPTKKSLERIVVPADQHQPH